eukprot:GEMP01003883.1.p1 GENE.GEMP01003883.1~~GEMP01003883.1.p1  ORF type:complete len:549 (+),score=146.94 GEMP01003883.1:480-2126(+)
MNVVLERLVEGSKQWVSEKVKVECDHPNVKAGRHVWLLQDFQVNHKFLNKGLASITFSNRQFQRGGKKEERRLMFKGDPATIHAFMLKVLKRPQPEPQRSSERELKRRQVISSLSSEQQEIVNAIRAGENIFFTGGAGTGKSFLLRLVIDLLPKETLAVTSSTGLAAQALQGTTLHQFAGLGIPEKGARVMDLCRRMKKNTVNRWRSCSVLILDEVSMVDGEFFGMVEEAARIIRKSLQPFGGLQLVIAGDFLQLPPISKEAKCQFCFESAAWERCVRKVIVLTQIFRQKDSIFASMLEEIRFGQPSDVTMKMLKSKLMQEHTADAGMISLLPRRHEVDAINVREMSALKTEERTFDADDSVFENINLDQILLVKRTITLKVGAQVILVKQYKNWPNGTRGVVKAFTGGLPVVTFSNGKKEEDLSIPRLNFSVKASGRELARRWQVPLDLAWALSIHKSQGMTLRNLLVDITNCFEEGQVYVALSRAESLDSLCIRGDVTKLRRTIRANPRCIEFYDSLTNAAMDRAAETDSIANRALDCASETQSHF